MYSGLRAAYNILKKNKYNREKNKNKNEMNQRVFLFSDGFVNYGEIKTDGGILGKVNEKKIRYGITTSSIGFGVEFNRDLLSNMSIVGEGDFYFIDSAKKIDFVVKIATFSIESLGFSTIPKIRGFLSAGICMLKSTNQVFQIILV